VAGGVLLGVGLARIPSSCSLATHQCAAPPKDPVFDRASGAVTLVNVGAIVGASGVVALGGSLIWYLTSPPRAVAPPSRANTRFTTAFAPWIGPGLVGLSVSGWL